MRSVEAMAVAIRTVTSRGRATAGEAATEGTEGDDGRLISRKI